LLDFHPAERRRGMTLEPGFAWMTWRDHLLEMVDTPGSEGLAHRRSLGLSASDAVVVVVGASDGVEYGTERVLEQAREAGLPCLVVVNRAERLADRSVLIAEIEAVANTRVLPLQLPFHDDDGQFAGVVNLLEDDGQVRVHRYDSAGSGRFSPEPVPERYWAAAQAAREQIVEAVAMADDELLEAYLEFLELPFERVRQGLARLVAERAVLPLLYTSAALQVGTATLLDAVVDLVPSPLQRVMPIARDTDGAPVQLQAEGPFLAQMVATALDNDGHPYQVLRVWAGQAPHGGAWVNGATGAKGKIRKLYEIRGPRRAVARNRGPGAMVATWDLLPGRPGATFTAGPRLTLSAPDPEPPMMSLLLSPITRRDEQSLPGAMARLLDLDPSLQLTDDAEGTLLAGQGQVHLEHALETLRSHLDVQVSASLPPVPYRETPLTQVRRAHGRYRKTEGGLVSQFGECWLELQPQLPERGVSFASAASQERVPERFLGALEEGVVQAAQRGPKGYPVVGVGVRCVDGQYDMLCSEEEHFRQAGAMAVRSALREAGTELLEPWSMVRITAAAGELGSIISEVRTRRGRILDLEVGERLAELEAHLPYREVRDFAPRLQSLTGGRGRFTAMHSHHERLPKEGLREALQQASRRASTADRSHRAPVPDFNA
jgi:elongation factor G